MIFFPNKFMIDNNLGSDEQIDECIQVNTTSNDSENEFQELETSLTF